jgi:hypothetical protein
MDDETADKLNRELAQRIHREALADPSSPYAGKVVGIANGEVVLVGDDRETTHRRLLEIEPNTWRCATFEPSRPAEYV